MMDGIALDGVALLAALNWERTEDDPRTWTARADDRFYLMTAHHEAGRGMLDVSEFHPRTGMLLREWRWTLGSTYDKLPDSESEGTA